jgi:hypothetical protein
MANNIMTGRATEYVKANILLTEILIRADKGEINITQFNKLLQNVLDGNIAFSLPDDKFGHLLYHLTTVDEHVETWKRLNAKLPNELRINDEVMAALDDMDLSYLPAQTFGQLFAIIYYSGDEEQDFLRNQELLNLRGQEDGAEAIWDSGFKRDYGSMRRRSAQNPYERKPGFYLVCVDIIAYLGHGETVKSVNQILEVGVKQFFIGSEMMAMVALQKDIVQLLDELSKLHVWGFDMVALEQGNGFLQVPCFDWFVEGRRFGFDAEGAAGRVSGYVRPVLQGVPKSLVPKAFDNAFTS